MKKILFISPGQFGTHTGTYYHCLLLKDKYNITYIGLDDGQKNHNIDGIKIIHIRRERVRNGLLDRKIFFKVIREELKNRHYDLIITNYFILCSILLFITNVNVVVSIRSGFISSKYFMKILYNIFMFLEIKLFKNITSLSKGMIKHLHLPSRTRVIPLGGPSFSFKNKSFESLNILYVGTFHERNIDNTIYAYAKFFKEYKDFIDMHYTIIGIGSRNDTKKIVDTIDDLGMDKHISYKGSVRYPELDEYMMGHNIGISYIPLKSHFEYQPPTKTYEYLLSGMAVLATGTIENKKVIKNNNGVITGDSIEEVYCGLKHIYMQRLSYNSEYIQKESQIYTWDSIIKNILIPYIESV